jgi:phospholipid/cholesterol/gamma-HCH transport system permease protein
MRLPGWRPDRLRNVHGTAFDSNGLNVARPESFIHVSTPDPGAGNGPHRKSHPAAQVQLSIGGELTLGGLPKIWREASRSLRSLRPKSVEVDASQLSCGDSACMALFASIRRAVARQGGQVNITGLHPDLKALLELATLPDPRAPQLRPPRPLGLIARFGKVADDALIGLKALIAFMGELCAGVIWSAFHPRQVRWRDVIIACEKAGADAVPVILLLGFLIGVMLAFQSAGQTERYGVRTVIPSVVAIAVTRELGPLITTLLLAGRTASAYAAELGTMKIDDELNALRTMGLDPVRFLAVPRVLAVIIAAPLLTVFCDLAGIVGGYTVMADHGYSFVHYIVQAHNSLNWADVFGGIGKTVLCALLIGAVGCEFGIRAGAGPRAVGRSTTRAVVMAILLVVAVDGSFGVAYYYLGI